MLITKISAEASRSASPPERCDLATLNSAPPTRVVDEADDAGNLLDLPEVNEWAVLIAIFLWCYAGGVFVNAVFPL